LSAAQPAAFGGADDPGAAQRWRAPVPGRKHVVRRDPALNAVDR